MASNGSIPTLGEDVPEDNLARLIRRKTPSYRVPINTGAYCACMGVNYICIHVLYVCTVCMYVSLQQVYYLDR